MEREEGEDMFFSFGLVGVGENISSFPIRVRDVNRRRRIESSQACLSVLKASQRQVKVN